MTLCFSKHYGNDVDPCSECESPFVSYVFGCSCFRGHDDYQSTRFFDSLVNISSPIFPGFKSVIIYPGTKACFFNLVDYGIREIAVFRLLVGDEYVFHASSLSLASLKSCSAGTLLPPSLSYNYL